MSADSSSSSGQPLPHPVDVDAQIPPRRVTLKQVRLSQDEQVARLADALRILLSVPLPEDEDSEG